MHEEQKHYTAFQQWCGDVSRDRKNAIENAATEIIALTASVESESAKANELATHIQNLQLEIGNKQTEQKNANAVRAAERKDFMAVDGDYSESIDALERAIVVLGKQNFDRKQAEDDLMQVASSPLVAAAQKSQLLSFVQQAPDPDAYEFQSSGVIDMLKGLRQKFKEERTNVQKEEMNKKFGYETAAQDNTNYVEKLEAELASKQSLQGAALAKAAEDKNTLEVTEKSKSEDEKYLGEATAECSLRAQEFQNRQKVRTEELNAIAEAQKVLSADAVSGAAEKHLPKLIQLRSTKRVAMLQTTSNRAVHVGAVARVEDYLEAQAAKFKSDNLSLAAIRASAGDPLGKVKKMIRDMLTKLRNEAQAETEKNAWCEKEVATNKNDRERLTSLVEEQMAEQEELSAQAQRLKAEKTRLSTEISDLDKAMAEATVLRTEESATNRQTIQDAQDGQNGVARAIQILKEFFDQAASGTVLVQDAKDDAPVTWDSDYKGQQSESGSVISMLEVLESDFIRLNTETEAQEDSNQRSYQKLLDESQQDKAVKNANLDNANNELTRTETQLEGVTKDLDNTNEELTASQNVYDKLKPQCIETGMSYEERVQKREDEIESLTNALELLRSD